MSNSLSKCYSPHQNQCKMKRICLVYMSLNLTSFLRWMLLKTNCSYMFSSNFQENRYCSTYVWNSHFNVVSNIVEKKKKKRNISNAQSECNLYIYIKKKKKFVLLWKTDLYFGSYLWMTVKIQWQFPQASNMYLQILRKSFSKEVCER